MDNTYEHRDFYLGAYLIVNGCELIAHVREHGMTIFTFRDSEKLHLLVESFYNLKGTVDALSYSSAIRALKSIVHASRSTKQQISTSKHEEIYHGSTNKIQGNL